MWSYSQAWYKSQAAKMYPCQNADHLEYCSMFLQKNYEDEGGGSRKGHLDDRAVVLGKKRIIKRTK